MLIRVLPVVRLTSKSAASSNPRPPRHRQEAAPAEAAALTAVVPVVAGAVALTAVVPVVAGAVAPAEEALEVEAPAEEEPNCPNAVMKKSATSA